MKMPYIELAGGLGDIFNQIYTGPGYRMLEHITGTMGILLVCHNPFAAELFTEHPKRELLLIHDPGYLQLAETVPVRVRCRTCRAETGAAANRLLCAACGAWQVDVVAGEEMLLQRVEIETAAEPVR